MTEITDCRMGVKLSLEACQKRQLSRRRWTKSKYSKTQQALEPAFLSCVSCPHWLSDEEYEERSTKKIGGFNDRK